MRDINKIILHCSATPEGRDVKVDDIRRWHLANGWDDIGYHFCIYADGSIHRGRDLDKSGAHTYGHNRNSIGICYIGGVDKEMNAKDTMTEMQDIAVLELVKSLRLIFGKLSLHGHNEFSSKSCPSFDVQDKYKFLNEQI
jgi:N-acetylmuramoyl-L-alanine amidase